MATPTPRRMYSREQPRGKSGTRKTIEIVDPRWLLRALGMTIAAAAALAYLTVCLLFYQGGWQLLLHPSRAVDTIPSVPFDAVRFDAAATGSPQLTGWWIASGSTTSRTILFLHDGSGSLSGSAQKLDLLHSAGVNIFAIDYRGFGKSAGPHPTEARMTEDTAAALDYLLNARHIPLADITPYGEGLGASLAADLASHQSGVTTVILDSPDPDVFSRATTGTRSNLIPMRRLLQERFDVGAPLLSLHTAKLLLSNNALAPAAAQTEASRALFNRAPTPRMIVTFAGANSRQAYVESVQRFLDEYGSR